MNAAGRVAACAELNPGASILSRRRYSSGLVVLALLLCCSGCSSLVNKVKSSMAETNGDIAYEKQDYSTAMAEYRTAADLGGGYGQFMLANMYFRGEAVKRDPKEALRLMEKSAAGGFPSANYVMGMARLNGSGVKPDATLAVRHFERAADQEHGSSMHMLGLMFASGVGVKQDEEEAMRWLRRASAQGFPVDDRLLTKAGLHDYAAKSRARSVRNQEAAAARQTLVREVQQSLSALGYDPGPIDGLFGNKTRSAIEAFQRDRGMDPDGQANAGLLEALQRAR